jgi:hypothetical protein
MSMPFCSAALYLVSDRQHPAAFLASYLLYISGCRMNLELEEGEEKLRAWGVMQQLLKCGWNVETASVVLDPIPELKRLLQALGAPEDVDLVRLVNWHKIVVQHRQTIIK